VPGLDGRVIAITRSGREAREFSRLVRKEGGRAMAIQAIEIVPQKGAAAKFLKLAGGHDYCAFMSAQAVRVLFAGDRKKVCSALASAKVIAVGPKTKQELEKRGVEVAMMPAKHSSIGLVQLLARKDQKGKRIIIPRSSEAGDYAASALQKLGMQVDEVFLYRARTAKVTPAWKRFHAMLAQEKIDAVVFTSASNVRSFFEITGGVRVDRLAQVISIGPFTSAELARRKVKYHEAGDHTVEGTVQVAKRLFKSRSA
jgi:uroporphyrinogen-III synthase